MKHNIKISAFGLLCLMAFGASIALLITSDNGWWWCLAVASAFLSLGNSSVDAGHKSVGTLHMFKDSNGFKAAGFEFKADPATISSFEEVTLSVEVDEVK